MGAIHGYNIRPSQFIRDRCDVHEMHLHYTNCLRFEAIVPPGDGGFYRRSSDSTRDTVSLCCPFSQIAHNHQGRPPQVGIY